jgi:hypothetical protein
MLTGTAIREQEGVRPASPQPQQVAVDDVLEAVRRDSRTDVQVFLQETEVPHGGE